jgi:DNA-binding transcriptional LysR family regulator
VSDHLEFRLLKYIVAVAETANFTRASERLFLAQPTLSQQVIALEEALGVRIFVRRREGIRLTPAGQMLYAYAQEMLDLRDEVVSAARAMDRGEIPALRIGLSSFINPDVLQSLREAYARLFPESPMQMTGGHPVQLLHRLEDKSLDAAILPLPVTGTNWVVAHIASDPLVVCMRSDDPLAAAREIPPSELAGRLKVFRDPETHPAAPPSPDGNADGDWNPARSILPCGYAGRHSIDGPKRVRPSAYRREDRACTKSHDQTNCGNTMDRRHGFRASCDRGSYRTINTSTPSSQDQTVGKSQTPSPATCIEARSNGIACINLPTSILDRSGTFRGKPERLRSLVLLFLKGIAIYVTAPVAQLFTLQSHQFDLVSRRILMSKRECVFGNRQNTQDAIVLL